MPIRPENKTYIQKIGRRLASASEPSARRIVANGAPQRTENRIPLQTAKLS